jgi:Flp pilus assembly protein TadD
MALALMESRKHEVFAAAKSGDWPRAEEQALGVLRVIPDDGDTHRLLGVVYLKQGRLDEAVPELETAVRLIPSDGAAHHNLGVAYGLQGRRNDAVAALTTAAEAGMDSQVGSDLLRVLEAVPERSPSVTELTKSAVRDFLAARRG